MTIETDDFAFAPRQRLVSAAPESSREEALEWSRRYPNPAGEGITTEIEVRPLYELEDFAPSDAIERFKTIGLPE